MEACVQPGISELVESLLSSCFSVSTERHCERLQKRVLTLHNCHLFCLLLTSTQTQHFLLNTFTQLIIHKADRVAHIP